MSRHIFKKEVIIHTPDYPADVDRLEAICAECTAYAERHKLLGPPNYYRIFTNNTPDDVIADISRNMEEVIDELSNSTDNVLLNMMNSYPFLSIKAHKSLFDNRWLNILCGLAVPVGLLLWLNIWRYRVRLDKDLKAIVKTSRDIQARIKQNLL